MEDLRDKVVLSFAASDTQEIRLTKGTEAMTLVRHEAPLAEETREKEESDTAKEASPPLKAKMVWQANDGRTAASAKVDELLAAVSQLACEKYITDHVTADYKDPIYTL